MANHSVVSSEEWLKARKELLAKEKEFTKLRDKISKTRRDLPWEKVHKEYVFETENGKQSLSDLFNGKSQLIVYHFMFDSSWEEGCPSCSFFADTNEGGIVHLNHRDVSMIFVSKAPLDRLLEFKKRMDWNFKWISSSENSFNKDYNVSFTPEEIKVGKTYYNYSIHQFPSTEAPGISVFYKDEDGNIFHTYSAYERGLDLLISAYNLLDIVPKGRGEEGLPYTMDWLRHHDRYGD